MLLNVTYLPWNINWKSHIYNNQGKSSGSVVEIVIGSIPSATGATTRCEVLAIAHSVGKY